MHPPSIAKEAEIQDFTPLDDFNQSFLSFVGFKDNGESTDRVPFDMKSTLVTFKDMARYLLAEEKLRIFFETNDLGGSPMASEVFGPEFYGYCKGVMFGVL